MRKQSLEVVSVKNEHWALIGDMVDSRGTEDRGAAFSVVSATLKELNRRFSREIAAPLLLTQGIDECSGVLRRPDEVLGMLHFLNLKIWPLKFRFGIGWGEVESLGKRATAGRMDGPGFHRASGALERARKGGLPVGLETELERDDPVVREALEALGLLFLRLSESWTPAMVKVLLAQMEGPDLTQARLAKKLGMSQQAVSKSLARGRWDEMLISESAARGLAARLATH